MRRLWVIGGGKGGVGKTFFAASMSTILARTGKSVIAVDADLGCPNLHTYLGIKSPPCTLVDYLDGRVGAGDLLLPTTQPGLNMISCAPSIPGSANPQFRQKEKIIEFIQELQADCVVVDLGSGTGFTVLDLFNMSEEGVVLSTPDPASMQNVYAFIKAAIFRRIQRRFGSNRAIAEIIREFQSSNGHTTSRTMLDLYDTLCTSEPMLAEQVAAVVDRFHPLIVINMADTDEDQQVAEIVQTTSKKFLNVDIRFCGLVYSDSSIRRATKKMTMLDIEDGENVVAGQIRQAVERLSNADHPASNQIHLHAPGPATPIMGLNDGLDIMNNKLHIQTEDLGFTGRCITTQVFCKGQVILTTRSAYPATIAEGNDQSQIVELMRKQHFNVIRELESKKVRLLRPV